MQHDELSINESTGHRAMRGDEVEAWLKRKRDEIEKHTQDWFPIDNLLDDYRLHADTGTPLNIDVRER